MEEIAVTLRKKGLKRLLQARNLAERNCKIVFRGGEVVEEIVELDFAQVEFVDCGLRHGIVGEVSGVLDLSGPETVFGEEQSGHLGADKFEHW